MPAPIPKRPVRTTIVPALGMPRSSDADVYMDYLEQENLQLRQIIEREKNVKT